jgi:hypothetical protein
MGQDQGSGGAAGARNNPLPVAAILGTVAAVLIARRRRRS